MEASQRAIVVGGAGLVGTGIVRRFAGLGNPVTVVDRTAPRDAGIEHIRADLLVDDVSLPDGLVVLANGTSDPRGIAPGRSSMRMPLRRRVFIVSFGDAA